MPEADQDAAFQQRFDLARMVLERKYRWAKRTLRNLQPVRRETGTLAVDRYMRLYHGPDADGWTNKEFVGALWHEVNHLLRYHPDRLEHLPQRYHMDGMLANVCADMEINDDLRDQKITLPEGLVYSDLYDHAPFLSAEEHFLKFVEDATPDPEPGDGEGEGEGKPDPTKPPKGKQPKPQDDPKCGSGSGAGDNDEELPGPTDEDLARLDKNQRHQDEDIIKASKDDSNGARAGLTGGIVKAAIARLGRAKHDWRKTFDAEVRNAMDSWADEREEYTFRRRSRRAGVSDEFILPGSFRPIPKLGVVVDVSGSMDHDKLTAALRQVHGILERLAIPAFNAYPCNQNVLGCVPVQTAADIDKVFESCGGGTDMMQGIAYAKERGDEVIIILTDCDTRWAKVGPDVPVVIGGIRRRDRTTIPKWARLVDVEKEGDDR